MIVERRTIVEGHKNGKSFRESGPCYQDPDKELAHYQDRIDNPPEETWQPTITKVTIKERMCSEWAVIKETE